MWQGRSTPRCCAFMAAPNGRDDKRRSSVLLLQEEVTHEHSFDARGVEAAHGVARGADQGFAEEVERRVVEHGQPGGLAGGMQQLPVERILVRSEERRVGKESRS